MAHAKACADDNTHVIRTQSSQSKKSEFSYLARSCLQLRQQEIWVEDYPPTQTTTVTLWDT